MKTTRTNRNRWIHLRLTEAEFRLIHDGFSNSTKQKISQYYRSLLLSKPIISYTRNRSYDEFTAEIILLKRELKAIGNNLNQAVRKLHTAGTEKELIYRSSTLQQHAVSCHEITEKIFKKVAQLSEKWLQE